MQVLWSPLQTEETWGWWWENFSLDDFIPSSKSNVQTGFNAEFDLDLKVDWQVRLCPQAGSGARTSMCEGQLPMGISLNGGSSSPEI